MWEIAPVFLNVQLTLQPDGKIIQACKSPLEAIITIHGRWIYGKEIDVNPNERYEFNAHMKLNEFATQSHITFEGFNQTSGEWDQLVQCPTGINGPIDWHVFGCEVTIPNNITKIRVGLNAGWSNQPNAEAVTYFDAINLVKLNNNQYHFSNLDLTQVKKAVASRISQEETP